ncbi:branched-chain amino acid transporter permease [Castellaniella caeni]|uniref:branched-chain amino acid transporter permease n=1 Tax=Castellaniella caeni TaxID=266123 RepID=UPI000830B7C0|nr:AzlD domain-containing protein [Castellaniella caeni]
MTDTDYVLITILLMGAVTLGLRALPFIAGHWLRRHALVQKLGDTLPLSIMVLLLVDTLAGQARQHAFGPWPELLAVAVVMLLQWRTRQTLLSIVAGTALYMVLRAL